MVLDEPNSNLDVAGESALLEALAHLRQKGSTVIIIAHRPSVLAGVDKILVLRQGTNDMFGPRDEVLAKLGGTGATSSPPKRESPPPPDKTTESQSTGA